MRVKAIIFFLSQFYATYSVFGQIYTSPNYGIKSHETLEINRIEVNQKNTIFYMTLENKITGGYFCTDKRTFLVYPDGTRLQMTRASGIPYCPENYKFTSAGEKLHFELYFPPVETKTKSIDLFEQCGDNCYWVYGIILDNELNKRIDEAFRYVERKESEKAIESVRKILNDIDDLNLGIEGLLYVTMIKLLNETGRASEAGEWINKMRISDAPHLQLFTKYMEETENKKGKY